MLDALNITEEEAAGLSELAALDLATARDFSRRAQAAEDPDVANRLARTAQRAAMSYRQTLALKVRLRREIAIHDREHPRKRDARRAARRMGEVREAVMRVALAEAEAHEGPEDERDEIFWDLMRCLGPHIAMRAEDPAFDTAPLDDEIVRAARQIGLPESLARAWRDLPEAPEEILAAWDGPDPP